MAALTLDLSPIATLNRSEFRKLCAANRDRKLERSPQGELIIMSPTGGETGSWNSELIIEIGLWNRQQKAGVICDSSTGFELPSGGDRSPDVSWIPLEKWNALTPQERKGFLPLCPDFVIELLSPSDSWTAGVRKMEEYQANGCRLGWLLDPKGKRVGIYRPNQPVQILHQPQILSGEDVLVGFELGVQFLWIE
ncbi:MAG: Uma2 family endonuclease [Roseofilum sp. SBFL]|uniref:Uma2 family endonuclease n=1 Tax=unclassified Roseofilum TaxID=2620099 RepID=UPI001B02F1C6|nr:MULTISPECIES: Uma2 family endonuclease [unclassified Roseofilum]MBP0015216.1 Uma2 family endonuclease [Roseofilum sp. SID3]MBP0024492.1 Uma2 family endonuclease [Roseofilum sp. SID2]MBP0038769.1 Uma2 family endonuclease [Roseofilum sp. SID1]MBP0044596.1 Uma2 family endonuclease [Roseofilum sp. SBFL]